MSDNMQKYGHRDSAYLRPTQDWQCARSTSCKVGPNENGQCPLTEQPCTPIRSVKARKHNISFWIQGLALAILVMFLANETLMNYLSPGPLSVNHAEVASCQDCHSAVSETIPDWISKGIHLNSNNDDKKCLSCHKLGENAFSPHSTSNQNFSPKPDPNIQQASTSSNWKVNFASQLRDWQSKESDDVSCAVCHREHQGKFAPIDAFDAQQCHVCHAVKFDKLDTEHPVYTQFPHERPTRIQFDHVSHLEKYFYEDDYFDIAPAGCKQCHDTDQSGEWMLSNTFEQSCSTCHLEEILGDTRANAKGVAVLSIPELDVRSLREAGYFIGQWPEWADGQMVPIMQLLLPTSFQRSAALQSTSLELFDLSAASPEELRSVAELAWGIKQLFYDIQMGGTPEMNQRISNALQGKLDQPTLNRLIASLPKDTLVNNQKEWFPTLIEDVTQFRNGKITLFDPARIKTNPPIVSAKSSTALTSSIDTQDILGTGDDDIDLNDDEIVLSDDDEIDLNDDSIGDINDDDDILLDDDADQGAILGGEETDILVEDDNTSIEGQDILAEEDSNILLDDDILEDDDVSDAELQAQASTDDTPNPLVKQVDDNEEWARTGGWYRDGSNIRYRPIDHSDPFLKAWLDVSSSKSDPITNLLFTSLSQEKSVGNCVKCHSVESVMSSSNEKASAGVTNASKHYINWRGFKPSDVIVDFNRFSHTSHFSLMNDDGCSSCHELNTDATTETKTQVASFLDMDRQTCTQCHQQGRAPDNCLTCHNYHVEPLVRSIEKISDSFQGGAGNE